LKRSEQSKKAICHLVRLWCVMEKWSEGGVRRTTSPKMLLLSKR